MTAIQLLIYLGFGGINFWILRGCGSGLSSGASLACVFGMTLIDVTKSYSITGELQMGLVAVGILGSVLGRISGIAAKAGNSDRSSDSGDATLEKLEPNETVLQVQAPSSIVGNSTVEARLQELQRLRSSGLITDDEFASQRQKVISAI